MTPNSEIFHGTPGAGKTTTLLNMVEEEMERGVPPDRIGFLAFTRKAANEAKERACKRFDLKPTQLPYFRTIHSLCFNALGLSPSDVLQGSKVLEFGDWIGVETTKPNTAEEGSNFGYKPGDRCLHLENMARVKGISLRQQYNQSDDDLEWALLDRVSRGLIEYKNKKALVDFTDMLSMFADSDWNARLEVLFVDEAQDLSLLQWRVIEKLSRRCRRVVICGDDDQSIYTFAGAATEHFINLPGRVTVLGQSHRVPRAVQSLAAEVIGRVRSRQPKAWAPRPEEGRVRRVQSLEEVDFAPDKEVLVLSRNACFLQKDAASLLRSEGVLYSFRGESSIERSIVEAVVTWEKLRRGELVSVEDAVKVYVHMNVGTSLRKGHKKLPGFPDRERLVSLSDLKETGGLLTDALWHDALDLLEAQTRAYMLKALRRGERVTKPPAVRLSTIHAVKGGECDTVVLYRDQASRSYREAQVNPADEHRCFYVAATRAKQELIIVAPQTNRNYDI